MNRRILFRLFIFCVIVISSQACTSLKERVDQLEAEVAQLGEGYGRMAIVAKSGGDYLDPLTAMDELANWCDSPSESNPCLMKIMPGVYSIGDRALDMQPYVSIEGSGVSATKLTAVGTEAIRGATAELSRLKVTHRPDAAYTEDIRTVIHRDGLFEITDVHLDLTGGVLQNADTGYPRLIVIYNEGGNLSLFKVSVYGAHSAPSVDSTLVEGIFVRGGRVSLNNVNVRVDGGMGPAIDLFDGYHKLSNVNAGTYYSEGATLHIRGDAHVKIVNSLLYAGGSVRPLSAASTTAARIMVTDIEWGFTPPLFPESATCAGISTLSANGDNQFFTNTCP